MRVQFARINRKVVTITRGRWMEDLHANGRLNPKPATLIERNFIEPKTSGLRCINVCVVKRHRFGWLSWVIEASSNRILIELSNNGMSRTAKRLNFEQFPVRIGQKWRIWWNVKLRIFRRAGAETRGVLEVCEGGRKCGEAPSCRHVSL